ncbi:hypothetical protein L209DRAFT_752884 [Thermothelomyces heterothallicus CBS 203.75]
MDDTTCVLGGRQTLRRVVVAERAVASERGSTAPRPGLRNRPRPSQALCSQALDPKIAAPLPRPVFSIEDEADAMVAAQSHESITEPISCHQGHNSPHRPPKRGCSRTWPDGSRQLFLQLGATWQLWLFSTGSISTAQRSGEVGQHKQERSGGVKQWGFTSVDLLQLFPSETQLFKETSQTVREGGHSRIELVTG